MTHKWSIFSLNERHRYPLVARAFHSCVKVGQSSSPIALLLTILGRSTCLSAALLLGLLSHLKDEVVGPSQALPGVKGSYVLNLYPFKRRLLCPVHTNTLGASEPQLWTHLPQNGKIELWRDGRSGPTKTCGSRRPVGEKVA